MSTPRSTHRLLVWSRPGIEPAETPVTLIDDRYLGPHGAVALHGTDGRAYWIGPAPEGRWEIRRMLGRPSNELTQEISLRIAGRKMTLRVTPEEYEAFMSAAGGQDVWFGRGPSAWFERLLAEHPLPRGKTLAGHLRDLGAAAARIDEE